MYSLAFGLGKKMCRNIERCIFGCVSLWDTLFCFTEVFMKKVLVFLLSLVFLMGIVACDNGERCEHDFQGKCEEHEVCTKCGTQRGFKKSHSYEGDCEDFRVCVDCGKINNEKIEHNYKGNIKIGTLSCINCKKYITEEEISQKSVEQLTDEERAYIYWQLNFILTLTKDGKYLYTTDVAFSIVW